MTPEQLATLKTYILANQDTATMYNEGNLGGLADALNSDASPAYWVYRRNIHAGELGKTVNYVAVSAMTAANLGRVADFLRMNEESFNGRDDVKSFLLDTFAGALGGQGAATRDALDLMLRRQASRFEGVFAVGTGSTAAPGTMALEGPISYMALIGL